MAGGDGQTKTADRYVFPFEKLEVWQKAIALADCILKLLEHVPQGRHLRLVSQMEGAATSIAQNIAAGSRDCPPNTPSSTHVTVVQPVERELAKFEVVGSRLEVGGKRQEEVGRGRRGEGWWQGSLYETVTLNEVFRIRKFFDEGECVEIRERAEHIDRKLNGLMNLVRGKKREQTVRG